MIRTTVWRLSASKKMLCLLVVCIFLYSFSTVCIFLYSSSTVSIFLSCFFSLRRPSVGILFSVLLVQLFGGGSHSFDVICLYFLQNFFFTTFNFNAACQYIGSLTVAIICCRNFHFSIYSLICLASNLILSFFCSLNIAFGTL